MAEADPKMVSESAAEGDAEEEEMASSSSDSGEESESSSSESSGSDSSTSCSSSCSGSSSGSRSNSRNRLYKKKRAPEPFRRVQRPPSGASFLETLPPAVRNRVQALRNIQEEFDKVDSLFLKAIHDLERKYAELNKPLNDRRYQIVNAEYEPTEKEYEWNSEDEEFSSDEEVQDDGPSEMPPLEGEEEEEEKPRVKAEEKEVPKEIPAIKAEEKEVPKEIPVVKAEEKANSKDCMEVTPEVKEEPKGAPQTKAEDKQPKARATTVREAHKRVPEETLQETVNLKRARKEKPETEDPKGIPHYWLTVLKNVEKLGPMIQKYDEPILKFLSDVTLKFSKPGQPISYTFEFHFLPNPYFTNEVLLKTYFIKSRPDHNDPFFSWGWEIEDCKGCKIDWRRGKDVTVTTTQSRTTATGEIEIQPRVVPNASFFNFFSPPEIPKIGKLEPREDAILDEDFEIGQILHDNVILKSIYYYTGEVNGTYYQDGRD
ncbi:nucleosome assembly protein 1-like 3 isoform X2 [Eulemur rufifrons]|uniref:nucleosome assembly protein 1-like 3 isoform X2 n=1 Tax=Eulemur rufifrons TaxID=859984 RepID=UPI003742CB78